MTEKDFFRILSKVCESMDVRIVGVNTKMDPDQVVTIILTLSISDTAQMAKLLLNLKSVPSVLEVYRTNA